MPSYPVRWKANLPSYPGDVPADSAELPGTLEGDSAELPGSVNKPSQTAESGPRIPDQSSEIDGPSTPVLSWIFRCSVERRLTCLKGQTVDGPGCRKRICRPTSWPMGHRRRGQLIELAPSSVSRYFGCRMVGGFGLPEACCSGILRFRSSVRRVG